MLALRFVDGIPLGLIVVLRFLHVGGIGLYMVSVAGDPDHVRLGNIHEGGGDIIHVAADAGAKLLQMRQVEFESVVLAEIDDQHGAAFAALRTIGKRTIVVRSRRILRRRSGDVRWRSLRRRTRRGILRLRRTLGSARRWRRRSSAIRRRILGGGCGSSAALIERPLQALASESA